MNRPLDSSHGNAAGTSAQAGQCDAHLTPDAQGRTWLTPGQTVRMFIGYSEVACHMRVAGTVMDVRLTTGIHPMAQLYSDNGHPFSFPIGTGEAGIFGSTRDGFYTYAEGQS